MQKLKVMLVEDEALERMLLRRFVEAEPDVYEVVREAAFAQEALEYLDEHAVDIVVTDINMPVMDGLEMAERILALDPDVQVIVTTGYSDFAHTRRAIQAGVTDYLVKPVDGAEFARILAGARVKLESKRGAAVAAPEVEREMAAAMPALRDRYLCDLLNGRVDPQRIAERLAFFQVALPGDCFRAASVQLLNPDHDLARRLYTLFTAQSMARQALGSVCVVVEGEGRLALLCGYPAQRTADFDALQRLLENALETPFMLGVGGAVDNLAEASRSYAQALRAVRCQSAQGGRQAVYYQDLGIVEEPPLWAEPLQAVVMGLEQTGFDLQAGRNAEARAWLERLFGDPAENVESARLRAAWVIAGLSTLRATPGVDVRERIGQVFELPAPADVRELLLALAGEATTTLDSIRTSAVSRQIQEILDYVRDHLAEPTLSLHETARLFFFNASYLSRIFKQNTGLAFRDYVNRQRIELARRYLDGPGAKAYEVGARVGIDDPNYFSTLFKKYMGMTVKQYRAGNENG